MISNREPCGGVTAKSQYGRAIFIRYFLVPAMGFAGATLLSAQVSKPGTPAPLLTREESNEIDAVTVAILKAGFPDAANAVVYLGELSVSSTFDPKDPPPFPSSRSKMQMTVPNSTRVTNNYQFDGLHFKLPDGTWLISLHYRYKAKPGDKMNLDSAQIISLEGLTDSAAREKAFDAAKDAAEWLKTVDPAHKARTKEEMNRLVPVLNHLKLSLDDLAPAVVLLTRAGWNEAGALSLPIADQRARKYWHLRPWSGAEFAFDPTGKYPNSQTDEQDWRKNHSVFSPEPPATALRRAMFRWTRAQITMASPEDAMLTPAVAAAVSKAIVDPKDPQGHAAKIDALLAGAALPVTPSEDSDLATRLQSWEAREREARMVVSGGNEAEKGKASISTMFVAPEPAYLPKKQDLDALVALLNDERPSRFWDFSGPRPIGDNALRALTILLEVDPRKLAGHPTDRPWTPAERKAAAAEVQSWWKQHRKEYVDK